MNLKSALGVTILLLPVAPAFAQNGSWQMISPVGHTFSVMMPTRPTLVSRRIRVSETVSTWSTFYTSVFEGKRFVATGFYKTNADTVPFLSSFEKFVEGMEHGLRANAKTKSLKFTRELSVGGAHGKQYELMIGEYSGVVRFMASENGFYALVMIGGGSKDRAAERFFSSFHVGGVNEDEATSGVTNNGNVITMVGSKGPNAKPSTADESAAPKGVVTPIRPDEDASVDVLPPLPWPEPAGPITGEVINGKALKLVQPLYPAAARNNHESGQVRVQIVINEVGKVVVAQALNGSPTLRVAAEAAAWQCKFTPTLLAGQPVKVSGIIIYNFVAQ